MCSESRVQRGAEAGALRNRSSSRSQRAVGRAALLANRLDAQLVLLHVMEPDQKH